MTQYAQCYLGLRFNTQLALHFANQFKKALCNFPSSQIKKPNLLFLKY